MYVLFNAQHQILIEEEDLLTQKKIYYFASPAKVKAVNSYSNKTAKIKRFFSPKSFPNYYWQKDNRVLRKQIRDNY
ncbi:MAG TPA: hypothetical protein H9861_02855 [Candidatus Ligilactobacillus excrementigallinarum]|uniref:Uncharacterized protein n=1 Tax=Candidatus Ligilactobacillus excrementigallinarum TaxID=2838641 RepID=A0A9D2AAC1_9LACO|nr:hypothetical protein [Candidatus Ligilactobacillus excrementigallinarum]